MDFVNAKPKKIGPESDLFLLATQGKAPLVLPAKPKQPRKSNNIDPNTYKWLESYTPTTLIWTPGQQKLWEEEEPTNPGIGPKDPKIPPKNNHICPTCKNNKVSLEEKFAGIPCWSCGGKL